MASSMGTISRRLYRSMFLTPAISCSHITKLLFCTEPSHHAYSSDADELSPDSVSETVSTSATSPDSSSLSSSGSTRQRIVADRPLEGGMDIGIYKAILVGQVGQNPLQKMLRNGRAVTLTSVGTGGMRNERIPFDNEEPREYADRCMVQWHRVVVYNERLGRIVMKHAQAGSILYLEGNLETKIFTDPISGLVRRVREIAIRRNGRIVFVGNNGDFCQPSPIELKGVGYY
ncbi:hypothetical protein Nepgr_002904 [Nepenthes gracilis]|uniref:Single-stranded DNA-binding protein, mitochondrial n=1 Tax=Nepenthes gracilis TaxID=150966 RepID=A0AAD3P4F6_NEPGR|nr:hypothetical protein Nepgr_002904 [Nepenthes gracilis]